ncbi:SDR family oxidoreductase [Nocardia colli]|uniref:SDR family oxidoreductase n=1 Tax=Nocardia colli TaxID=2545717 RepID=A0A5N0DZ72_9NOCA|nr:SDR family oxidoreductase [Nocardia colli]KAA8882013.1 SDR family oxidoreductase [Nocardia colli]
MSGVSRQVGLVTGAGSGIGRAAAVAFARNGAAVAVLDIDERAAAETTELIAKDGGEALAGVVDIASNGGLYSIPNAPAYVAAKHGIVGLTKAAAVDYAHNDIRVNAVCPGPTRTRQAATTPLGRLGTPEEAAAAAVWLCSDAASYITGVTLSVDGGRRP